MTGNSHVRRLLVEAAWHHRARYVVGTTMCDRWELASPAARARGDAGNRRLHARWNTFRDPPQAASGRQRRDARELAGWCWSLNLVLPLLAVGAASAHAEERTVSALELLGLADCGNHLVEELSGGQQQRVSIARALSLDPYVIIADDPTNDLDAPNRQRVLELLGDHASRGGAVVLASAEPDAVLIATRVITT